MRIGHNPARYVQDVAQPAEITIAVVNCIPFLSGYYEQSLEVLKVVIESLNTTREPRHPYDVMVFDNHSCREVRDYLHKAYELHKVQYLVLSDTNIGKIGAWNTMFGAAQGKYIVFSDGDVGFRPGWLKASLDLFKAFPNVGMVTARPLQTPMEFSLATLEWGRKQGREVMEEGQFLRSDIYAEHMLSLGQEEINQEGEFSKVLMYRLTYGGRKAFIGAAHFQFMARADVLKQIIPLPSLQPMRGERSLDVIINQRGLLRLTTEKALVWHMGNQVRDVVVSKRERKKFLQRILWFSPIKRFLLRVYNQIFKLYFHNVE